MRKTAHGRIKDKLIIRSVLVVGSNVIELIQISYHLIQQVMMNKGAFTYSIFRPLKPTPPQQ